MMTSKPTSDFIQFVKARLLPLENLPDLKIEGLKQAAVLLLLFFDQGEWNILFIHRADAGEFHRGEVAFPGGSRESFDKNLAETALRETFEELGIEPKKISLLGHLPPISTVTRFHVTPFIGILEWPAEMSLNPVEVMHCFTIPLNWLSNPDNWQDKEIEVTGRGLISTIVYRDYKNEHLWGVTGRITNSFTQKLI